MSKNLKSDEFYISNYGTDENINIFKDIQEAYQDSIDNKVHKVSLSEDLVFYENDIGWNYDDTAGLFQSEPVEVYNETLNAQEQIAKFLKNDELADEVIVNDNKISFKILIDEIADNTDITSKEKEDFLSNLNKQLEQIANIEPVTQATQHGNFLLVDINSSPKLSQDIQKEAK